MDVDLPKDIQPSDKILNFLKNEKDKEELIILMGQMSILYKVSKNVPKRMSNEDWKSLLKMKTVGDRESFINFLHNKEVEAINVSMERKISDINKEKYEKGEMVYARYYHQLFECYGNDFRERINQNYGYKYLNLFKNNEVIPKLLFDCRHLYKLPFASQQNITKNIQQLWNSLWFQGHPFDITLTNCFTDSVLSDVIKKNFTFLYGLQKETIENIQTDEDGYIVSPESSFSLKPALSMRGTHHFYDKKTDNVAFISPKAKQFLPENIKSFNTFIICPTNESENMLSMSIAKDEKLPAYKLPIEKYVKWKKGSKNLNPYIIGKILSSLYYSNDGWEKALTDHIPEYHFSEINNEERAQKVRLHLDRENTRKLLTKFTYNMRKISLDDKNWSSKFVGEKNIGSSEINKRDKNCHKKDMSKKSRIHRYSREERNERRKEISKML
uniref:SAM-dependent MTase TRM10-type domain-containing protein n=1 Tax=Parastrongyloides trichosuri TaxID=131310 RepID=A0A0N4ZUQ0_PARTI